MKDPRGELQIVDIWHILLKIHKEFFHR